MPLRKPELLQVLPRRQTPVLNVAFAAAQWMERAVGMRELGLGLDRIELSLPAGGGQGRYLNDLLPRNTNAPSRLIDEVLLPV